MYTKATGHIAVPSSWYPMVSGEPDEQAARDAHSSINTLLDYKAARLPDAPYLCDPNVELGRCINYTFKQTKRLVILAAKAWARELGVVKSEKDAKVVAMCGRSGVDYWLNNIALQRLGHIPLHLSNTLSSLSAAKLIRENNASYFLLGPDSQHILSALPDDEILCLEWRIASKLFPVIDFVSAQDEMETTLSLPPDILADRIASISHSTGSTADPKSIPMINRAMIFIACRDPRPMSRLVASSQAHPYAFAITIVAMAGGNPIYIYPGLPYTYDHLSAVVRLIDGRADSFYGIPLFYKILTSRPEGVKLLQSFKEVVECSSAILPDQVETITKAGIPIFSVTGSSEALFMLTSGHASLDPDEISWVDIPAELERYTEMEPYDAESYELVYKKGYPGIHVFSRADAYATGDLYIRHSTLDKWKWSRRKGDVIIHDSGLKSDPLIIEAAFSASPHVKHVLAIGNDHPIAGALVIPSSNLLMVDSLQTIIDNLNEILPLQSRLRSGMCRVLSVSDQFVMSPKGTIIRGKSNEKWKEVIDGMYKDIDAGRVFGSHSAE